MTSETRIILDQVQNYITNNNAIFPKGYGYCFRDPESDLIYLRQFGNSNELTQFPPIDTEGNFFYVRHIETEKASLSTINRQSSCLERFVQTYQFRAVFVFTANDQWEVGDYTLTTFIGCHIDPFRNVNNILIEPVQILYDYLNFNDEDTAGEIRTYMPSIQSFAIDFNLIFAREFDNCRNPPELI